VPVTEPPAEFTGAVLERIKVSVKVLEFVGEYVELKPTVSDAIGLCPSHDDRPPSFEVNVEGNYWHCFAGCGRGLVSGTKCGEVKSTWPCLRLTGIP